MSETISTQFMREMNSPIGKLTLVAEEQGITRIEFESSTRVAKDSPSNEHLDQCELQLREYFNGTRTEFDVKLSPKGTEFQLEVWNQLLDVGFGETTSYGDIARRIDRPKAMRAVGAANVANPIPIIVPCHRIIGSNRTLTGYAGGLAIKRWLLEHEGIKIENDHLRVHEDGRQQKLSFEG